MSKKLESMTKAELVATVNTLSSELAALRAKVSELETSLAAAKAAPAPAAAAPAVAARYPFVDGIGRRFRVEERGGRVIRCFAPGN